MPMSDPNPIWPGTLEGNDQKAKSRCPGVASVTLGSKFGDATDHSPRLTAANQARHNYGVEPLAVSVKEAVHLLGIGRTHLYQQVNEGNLVARKIGSRTVITMASIKALLGAS